MKIIDKIAEIIGWDRSRIYYPSNAAIIATSILLTAFLVWLASLTIDFLFQK